MRSSLFFILLIYNLTAKAQLNKFVEEWKKDPALKNASIGFSVADALTGKVIGEYQSHLGLVPASTLKIVTTAVALKQLGPEFRYETKLAFAGSLDTTKGELKGDLVIVGGGDPTLESENFYKITEPVTEQWSKTLKKKGIRSIQGSIVVEASAMPREIPGTWLWEDVCNYFGAVPCGLNFADNKFKIYFNSAESGSQATIIKIAPSYYTRTLSLVSTVLAKGNDDQAYLYGDPFSFEKRISGTIPPKKNNYEVEGALPDPALLCAEFLHISLKKNGIVNNRDSLKINYNGSEKTTSLTPLFSHYSVPLSQIVLFTNQNSINLYSETLLRSLGQGHTEPGLTRIKKQCLAWGLDTTELFMKDGCGLARLNTMTCDFQTRLLSKIYNDSLIYPAFNGSLPVAGKHVSMSNIGKTTKIENNLRAKTGYMQRVRAYCGYVRTRSGKDLCFSVIFNNYNCSAREAKLKIEKFLVALYEL